MLILNAIEKRVFEGVVLDITLLNIDYIARKQVKEIKSFIKLISNLFEIVGGTNERFVKALNLDNNDLEDSLQYICAIESGCDLIVTNDGNFYNDEIKIMNSKEFVKKFLHKEEK